MSRLFTIIVLSGSLLLSACATSYHPYQHTMGGAALGAAVGAVAGHQVHHKNGRYVGAVTGALIGGALGNSYDQRQNAYYQAPPNRLQYDNSSGYYQGGYNPYSGNQTSQSGYNTGY
ncbi:MAG: glycine zipper 2TM domain-containing protein [Candidatus Competibacteraceae bacterium]|nr:glycine zipper 2TM domain-containing protein [Candidatus Competibacteraceae bacterium]